MTDGAWKGLLAHVRRALHDLPQEQVTPAVVRLRGAPAKRLRTGRMRRDLAELLATSAPVWRAVHERLAAADAGEDLAFLLAGEPPPAVAEPVSAADAPREPATDAADELRSRLRERTKQRDEARRQTAGAESRATAAQSQVEELTRQLDEQRRATATAEAALELATAEQQRAVDRERRRQDAVVAGLREELAALRRGAQDRAKAAKDREVAAEVAAQRAEAKRREEREAARQRRSGAPDLAAPGRPSDLPPGVAEGTTKHAKALLAPGRRIIVDGYNVAKSVQNLPTEAAERAWLEQQLQLLATRFNVQVEVYWDGEGASPEPPRLVGNILVQFSPAGVDADDDIELAVAASEDDEPLVVVTDDRELRDRVRPYRVDLLGTQSFHWALRG